MTPPDASACPPVETLERFAAGDVTAAAVLRHLDECSACRTELSRITTENSFLSEFESLEPLPRGSPADEIAGYTMIGEIHRGGQGVVYRAVQESTKREVAVKTLLQGSFATARQRLRFDREVELAARLKHPCIVAVHDSGRAANGAHYVAMEYVDGVPLDEFLRAPEYDVVALGRVAIDRILGLFSAIGDAVSYAHQRGVIHRDLKPGNIVVDAEARPHVLDFGIAKAVEEVASPGSLSTRTGEFVGTFNYAAPEQVSGHPDQVDVRVDVYALGTLLYEALTGRRAIEQVTSISEVIHQITDLEPPRPSSIQPAVDEDCEIIVRRAMTKDADRRYQSAAEFRGDIDRRLRGEAIHARRDDAWYMLRKSLARHRVPVTVAAAFVVLVISFGAASSVLLVKKTIADRQRDARRAEASNALETVVAYFANRDKETADFKSNEELEIQRAREIREKLGTLIEEYPSVVSSLATKLGEIFTDEALYDEARRQFELALTARVRVFVPPHDLLAEAHHNLGRISYKLGGYASAEPEYREALRQRVALFGPDDLLVAATTQHLAATLQEMGRYSEAGPLWERAIEIREARLSPEDADYPDVFNSKLGLATFLRDTGRFAEALGQFREVRVYLREKFEEPGKSDWRVARTSHSIGSCLIDLGHFDEAEGELADAMRTKRALWSVDHVEVASTMHEQARLTLARAGSTDQAEAMCRQVLVIREATYGPAHRMVGDSRVLLGQIRLAAGDPTDAESHARAGLAILREKLRTDHWRVAVAESVLAEILGAQGRFEDAEPLHNAALLVLASTHAEASPATIEAMERAAAMYTPWGREDLHRKYRDRIERARGLGSVGG